MADVHNSTKTPTSETPVRAKFNRRRYLINKEVQLKLIAIVVGFVVINVALFYMSVSHILKSVSDHMKLVSDLPDVDRQAILSFAEGIFNNTLLFTLAFYFCLAIYLLYFSNRIVGPIFNINRVVNNFAKRQQPDRVRLRKNDFFHGFGADINRVLDMLDKENAHLKESDPEIARNEE